MTRTGVWLVGARGNVATTAVVGARAIAHGHASTTGLVTSRPPLTELGLPPVGEFVFGGHEVQQGSLVENARNLAERNGVPDSATVSAVEEDLAAVDRRIETGTAINCGAAVTDHADAVRDDPPLHAVVEELRADYEAFRREHNLDRVVVMNVASTEPTLARPDRYDTVDAVERAVEDDEDLPASSIYAYAALVDGHPFVNFTPNVGSSLGGLRELAVEAGVPHMGNDGKTGETLVKSALAPMFAGRHLRVLSWEGHNILGNTDGRVLEEDANEAGKLESKGAVLERILPDIEHNAVRIDYTPSLNDWKTAWDHVHFEGFLNTEMTMQFTWKGSDSALAAPLVLDLARLIAHADEHGEGGIQPHLASFFKAPLGVEEHDLSRQFDMLDEYVDEHTAGNGQ